MNAAGNLAARTPFATLRRMARPRSNVEQCEFCNLPLPATHRHLLETAARKIICACDACALRFDNVIGRYKLIPRDTKPLSDFRITDAQWDSFSLPIELAFFFRSSPVGRVVALYPSPAGATESLLQMASWDALASENPELASMEADVQALLVNRLKGAREYYLAPIDVCFELAGLIRLLWRGFSGGDKVWEELGRFFERLRQGTGSSFGAEVEASHA
ncbi:MAG TPA: DUF5947 family protein [Candidatus Dormibacteraeota bacterium]|nr:DUF5947 family protein [Candidatus Dormibacteraeota bacterium]